MASADGFTEVRRRKRRHGRSTLNQQNVVPPVSMGKDDNYYSGPDTKQLLHKIAMCRQQLKETQFYKDLIDLMESFTFSTIVCYGIGHIGTCHIARHQFALLIEMAHFYKTPTTRLYDPVLHKEERTAIRECGCQTISQNEHCKHRAGEDTLFFMPHCSKAMYNNVLWANWGEDQLTKIAIIGNSFNSYHEKLTQEQLSKEAPYIFQIKSACVESPLPTNYLDDTIFNNTSLHIFPQDHLNTLDKRVWEHHPEPKVDPLDPEIVT